MVKFMRNGRADMPTSKYSLIIKGAHEREEVVIEQ